MARKPDTSVRTDAELRLLANQMRRNIIRMLEAAGSGHPGGSLSIAEMMATLWFGGVMSYDPREPKSHGRDLFILSKGHAAPAMYAVFAELGWITDADLLSLRHLGSKLQGHPDPHMCPGVEVGTGSLGQGLSIASGLALGLRMDVAGMPEDLRRLRQVFVVTGDGELQEGQNWEALMFAAHRGLDNLTLLVDLNDLQIDGHVSEVCSLGDLRTKLEAFGWDVAEADGHSIPELRAALTRAAGEAEGKPHAIICHTVKGKGVSFMENQVGWHGVAPTAEQAAEALAELDAERAALLAEAAGAGKEA